MICANYVGPKLYLIVIAAAFVLGACAGPVQRADDYIAQDEWMKAVLEYRKAATSHPADVEFRSRLKQTEHKAADYYYQRGLSLLEQDSLDAAILQFQQGLAAVPDHGKLLQVMNQALVRKETNSLYEQAAREIEAGKQEEGRRLLRRALDAYPGHKRAAELLARFEKQALDEEGEDRLALTSRAPITLNFRQTDLRTAFEFIAKSFGVDVIFDEAVKSAPITLFAKDATFEQALSLMLTTTKTFYKKVGPNTILIAPDSKEKRGQYEDQLVRTFHLSSIRAKEMADILKGVINVKKLIVNEAQNTLVVRDAEEVIKLADKIIEANDRRPAELIMEVEILEVNRSKAERLGLDLGSSRVTAAIPSATPIPIVGSVSDAIRNAITLTLPSATFNFYKQDVDAKILANPKIRVLSGKSAKIHIGDRIPLRGASIQGAAGFVSTTYEYKEIGIRLLAEPIVHLDNSVTVKVNLEVSSLGENLGTPNEPAFRIGTRNAETHMMLRDGETAILGGLIRDEDRKTRARVPLFGDIPAIGTIFTSYDDAKGRTDVLLTITPRVVRGWDLPGKEIRSFMSGTEERYLSQSLFAKLATPLVRTGKTETVAAAPAPAPSTAGTPVQPGQQTASDSPNATTPATPSDQNPPAVPAPTAATLPAEASPPVPTPPPVTAGQPPLFAFSQPIYEGVTGKEFEIQLTADNLDGVLSLPMEIMFNPQLVKFVRGEPGSFVSKDFKAEADDARGLLRVTLNFQDNAAARGNGVLGRLVLRGERPGISYLVYRTPTVRSSTGETVSAQVRASRVVIK